MSLCSIFISLFSYVSLCMSISTSARFYLFLCSSLFLTLFSCTTLLLFSSSLFSLSAQLSCLNFLTMFSRAVRVSCLRKSRTCPEGQSAREFALPLNGELLALRRKNLYWCSCALEMEMCLRSACGVVCVVVWCCCVVCGCPWRSHRYSCRLSALV